MDRPASTKTPLQPWRSARQFAGSYSSPPSQRPSPEPRFTTQRERRPPAAAGRCGRSSARSGASRRGFRRHSRGSMLQSTAATCSSSRSVQSTPLPLLLRQRAWRPHSGPRETSTCLSHVGCSCGRAHGGAKHRTPLGDSTDHARLGMAPGQGAARTDALIAAVLVWSCVRGTLRGACLD